MDGIVVDNTTKKWTLYCAAKAARSWATTRSCESIETLEALVLAHGWLLQLFKLIGYNRKHPMQPNELIDLFSQPTHACLPEGPSEALLCEDRPSALCLRVVERIPNELLNVDAYFKKSDL